MGSARELWRAVVVGLVLAAGLAIVLVAPWQSVAVHVGADYFVPALRGEVVTDPMQQRLVFGDGQPMFELAQDPTLARAVETFGSPAMAAYRAQRIAVPYAAWALTLGRPALMPAALGVLTVASAGALVAGVAVLLRRRGAPLFWAPAAVLLPGALTSIAWWGCDLPAVAAGLWGALLWTSARPRRLAAVLLMVVAALARENMALVPVALVLAGHGRPGLVRCSLRQASPALLAPFVALAGWLAIVHARVGAWPWERSDGALDLPLRGLLLAARVVQDPAVSALALAGCVAAVVLVVRWERRSWLGVLALLHAGLGVVMGELVWESWRYFSRPLLPLLVAGLVVGIDRWAPKTAPAGVAALPRPSTA